MPAQTLNNHVCLNESGVPIIAGTTVKVIEVVLDQQAYGWSPEEIHFQHRHLSMAQIHSALAYYWDHKEELDQDMDRRLASADEMRRLAPVSPLAQRLGASKRSQCP